MWLILHSSSYRYYYADVTRSSMTLELQRNKHRVYHADDIKEWIMDVRSLLLIPSSLCNITTQSKLWRESIVGPNEANVTHRNTARLVVEQILLDYRIKEGEIIGHMTWVESTLTHRNLKVGSLGDEDANGQAIIKWLFNIQGVKECCGFVWLRNGIHCRPSTVRHVGVLKLRRHNTDCSRVISIPDLARFKASPPRRRLVESSLTDWP